jgi:hypothetical protein
MIDLMWENSSIVLKELTMHRILGVTIIAMFLVVASSFAAEDGAAL